MTIEIKNNIKHITNVLPEQVQLIAVSKTKPNEMILEAYEAGQRTFGENKVQDLAEKHDVLPKDISWHFIGHLQTNKVKYIAPFVSLIHAVDSIKLLETINKEALKNNRTIQCLLQFHIAQEESKFGLNLQSAEEILRSERFTALKNIEICGVMGMATNTSNQQQVKSEFDKLYEIFETLKATYFKDQISFKERSMGMSGDYLLAVECGSTMVRIGSTIFGHRQ